MYQMIESNGKLFQLIRIIKKQEFTELSHANEYKNYIKCDHVLQDAENFMFCRSVDDIEFEMI